MVNIQSGNLFFGGSWSFSAEGVLTKGNAAADRIITIPVAKTQSTSGYIDWVASGAAWPAITGLGSTPNIAGGYSITIPIWTAIIGRHTRGGNYTAAALYALAYTQTNLTDLLQPGDIILCMRNGSANNQDKLVLGSGQVIGGGVSIVNGGMRISGAAAEIKSLLLEGTNINPTAAAVKLTFQQAQNAAGAPNNNWFSFLTMQHYDQFFTQIAADFNTDSLYFRRKQSGNLKPWRKVAWDDAKANLASPVFTGTPKILDANGSQNRIAVVAETSNQDETDLPVGSYVFVRDHIVSNLLVIERNKEVTVYISVLSGSNCLYNLDGDYAVALSGTWRACGGYMNGYILARRVA